ncbi:uncharacterized protein HD556DRAFT_1212328, partial [Suillus plorans]
DGTNEDHELHCRAMLMLFKPWRKFEDLKCHNDTWAESLEQQAFAPELSRVMQNMNVENECKDACDTH